MHKEEKGISALSTVGLKIYHVLVYSAAFTCLTYQTKKPVFLIFLCFSFLILLHDTLRTIQHYLLWIVHTSQISIAMMTLELFPFF